MSGLYQRNVAVNGFPFLMRQTDGSALTGAAGAITGSYVIDDGTQATLSGTIAEKGNGQYTIDLTADEMNGALIGLLFTHASAVPEHIRIPTAGFGPATAGESTLSVTYSELLKELGWFWLGERSTFTAEETDIIDGVMISGLRQFYRAHQWRFLHNTLTVTTVSGTDDYDMADNFNGVWGPITYVNADDSPVIIEVVPETRILQYRQYETIESYYPRYAAFRPKSSDGSDGQRWEMMLWPSPDAAYTLQLECQVNPSKLTAAKPYPLGGMLHSETILNSCMSVMEKRCHREQTYWRDAYMEALAQSIERDGDQAVPDSYGLNLDAGTRSRSAYDLLHMFHGSAVLTYDGTDYSS